jgi:formate dehydrogenase iron-sulfur subunit
MSAAVAILVDTTRCTGCDRCVVTCKKENDLGPDRPQRWKSRIDALSSTRYTTILQEQGDHFVRRFCRHCMEPACASACLVGALQKLPHGPVVYDSDRCMGCRYCMNACPYGIPRYEWEESVPHVRKCTFCYLRLEEARLPACVEACPEKAAVFGKREALLVEARSRLRAQPDRYVDHIYGEHEVGGTSILYISDIPLDFLAYQPNLGNEPLPELTWAAMQKVPPVVVGMSGLMLGVYWITKRRMQLAAEAAQAKATTSGSAAGNTPHDATESDSASAGDHDS